MRQYWSEQELTTDEAVVAWGDPGLPNLQRMDWDASNEFVTAMYNRLYYQIVLANEYLRETTDEKLGGRGVDGELRNNIINYRARLISYAPSVTGTPWICSVTYLL